VKKVSRKKVISELCKLGNNWKRNWASALNIPDEHMVHPEAAVEKVRNRRAGWITVGILTVVFIVSIVDPAVNKGFLGWILTGVIGMLTGFVIAQMINTWDTRPGKTTRTLAKHWSKVRPRAKKLIRDLMDDDEEYTFEEAIISQMRYLARQVREHEVEGREDSRKRARQKLQKLKDFGDKVGLETPTLKSIFEE
jgi:hypothetical protein